MELIITTPEALQQVVDAAVKKAFEAFQPSQTYTVNQVSKLLRKGSRTITKMIADGTLKTTADGKITADELKRYLTGV